MTIPVIRTDAEAVAVARQVAAALRPGAAARDRRGGFPHEAMRLFDGSGLLGIRVPAAHGGAGVTQSTVAEVFRIIAGADPAVAQIPQSHFAFVDALLVGSGGTDAFRAELFAAVLDGARIGNAASERGTPTAAAFTTRLDRDGDGWRLTGRKYYATGAIGSAWVAVYAMHGDDVALAFVRTGEPGVSLDDDWHGMGQRATGSGTAAFDRVHVAAHRVLSPWREPGLRRAWWLAGRVAHTAIDVGIAEDALADGLHHLTRRARVAPGLPFSAPGEDPLVQRSVGRVAAQVEAARLLLGDAAAKVDRVWADDDDEDDVVAARIALDLAKAQSAEAAVDVASQIFGWSGSSSADERHDLHRHWRNARTHSLHDPVEWKYASAGAALIARSATRPRDAHPTTTHPSR